jgi:hypothetical protein
VLPPAFYAAGERVEGALQRDMVRRTVDEEESIYLWKKDHLAIRTADRDRLVALLEIVSPGNKASRREMERFLRRITSALEHGYHLLVIDLCLPSDFDPHGVHGAIWESLCDEGFEGPADRLLTVASYVAAECPTAYVEPLAVGDVLPDMPLFLAADRYVSVPLEETYLQAWAGFPGPWKAEVQD